MFLFSL